MGPLNVAVIGCGTAGSAAALFLQRAGHKVEIFERVPDPGPVGAALLMQPSGMGALSALGLLDDVLAAGEPVDRLFGTTVRGRTVIDLRYEDLRADLYGVGLHRGTLFETLVGAVARADIAVHTGVEIVGFESTGPAILNDAEGNSHGPYDLAVVADGARSGLRSASGVHCKARKYPWGALWATVATSSDVARNSLRQYFHGTRTMLGLLPAGKRPEHPGKRNLSIFWSMPVEEGERVRDSADLAAWKRQVLATSETTEPLLAEVNSPDQLTFAAYHDVRIPEPVIGGVVFIGDAAHATSPQLGHGANLALVDAQALAGALAQHGQTAAALQAFARSRKSQVNFYRRASRLITPWFQSGLTPLTLVRDNLLGPLARSGPLYRQMLLTLAGVKKGTLRSAPESDWPELPQRPAHARSPRRRVE